MLTVEITQVCMYSLKNCSYWSLIFIMCVCFGTRCCLKLACFYTRTVKVLQLTYADIYETDRVYGVLMVYWLGCQT